MPDNQSTEERPVAERTPEYIIARTICNDQFGDAHTDGFYALNQVARAGWLLNAGAAVRALEAAGYAVVKLPTPTMEPRVYADQSALTWTDNPGAATRLRVQVYEADGQWIAEDKDGGYTSEEAIARGACLIAAGVEAKRLQGGEPR